MYGEDEHSIAFCGVVSWSVAETVQKSAAHLAADFVLQVTSALYVYFPVL